MKKILFLIDSLNGGGAEKALVDLVNNLPIDLFDITVMTIYDEGYYKNKLNKNIKYKSLALKHFKGINYIYKFLPAEYLYKKFIKEKYDIEIAFLEGICTKIISGSFNIYSKKICWVRTDISSHKKSLVCFFNKNQLKESYTKFSFICFVGIDSLNKFKNLLGDFKNLIVFPNITNVEKIISLSQEKEEIINKYEEGFKLLSIGRLIKSKGYIRLIEIMHEIDKKKIPFKLWILGEGSERKRLEKLIKEYQLSEKIFLLGFQKNPYKFIKSADIFICSSYAEGFSTVLKEASILKKIIVTTKCSGTEELLGASEYGLISENTKEDLLSKMILILTNEKLRLKYKKKIAEIKNIYSVEKNIKSFMDLMEGKGNNDE